MSSWAEQARELENTLRLRTFPVAMKLLPTVDELEQIRRVRRLDHPSTFCQVITLARTAGWTVGVTENELSGGCAQVMGLMEPTPDRMDGSLTLGVWFKNQEDARKHQEAIPRLPLNHHQAIVVAPLAAEKFEPEILLIFATPAQMILFINGLQWEGYTRFQFYCVGETACSDSICQCYLSGQPSVAIPCYGERRYGHVAEDELVMALPPKMLEKALVGLRGLAAAGLRYPIPPFGAQTNPLPGLARSYGDRVSTAAQLKK